MLFLILIQSVAPPQFAYALQAGGVEIGDLETGSVVGQPFRDIDIPVLPMTLLGFEVTQAIQGMNPSNPLDPQTNNTVKLVAGKKTVVRALSSSSKCNTASPDGQGCCHADKIIPTLDCGRT